MSFWKAVANPISSALDAVGIGGFESGLDSLTGRGAAKAASESAKQDRELQLALHREQIALQREFAQQGIRWRVEDAKAAGIHPLAAVGASGASYSPAIPVIDPIPDKDAWRHTMGQNIRSFVMGRIDPMQRALGMLNVERAGLENQLLKLQIQNEQKGQSGSADPHLSGQGDSLKGNPMVIDEPLRRVVSDPVDPSKEMGAIQDWQIVRTQKGYAVVPSKGVKEAIEDSPMEWQWLIRAAKRTYPFPGGGTGRMNPVTGELYKVNPERPWWNYFFGNPDKRRN